MNYPISCQIRFQRKRIKRIEAELKQELRGKTEQQRKEIEYIYQNLLIGEQAILKTLFSVYQGNQIIFTNTLGEKNNND